MQISLWGELHTKEALSMVLSHISPAGRSIYRRPYCEVLHAKIGGKQLAVQLQRKKLILLYIPDTEAQGLILEHV